MDRRTHLTFLLATLGAGCAGGGGGGSASAPSPTTPVTSGMRDLSSVQLSRLMGAGWNLGNSLEAIGGETAWGNPATTQALMDAVKAAGFAHHSHISACSTGEVLDELPYYGQALQRHVGFGTGVETDSDEKRYGRVANPTVHIGLNQLRLVVNSLITMPTSRLSILPNPTILPPVSRRS